MNQAEQRAKAQVTPRVSLTTECVCACGGPQCVELLKVIEFAFRRKNASIAECQSLLLRHMASEILDVFRPLKRKLQGRLNHQKREILLAVSGSLRRGACVGWAACPAHACAAVCVAAPPPPCAHRRHRSTC